ncbi:Repeat domain-containing protein [Fodinibius salinus]|uniref:Repeat domain-containing protein n=1 Tax=Fodinibius salinus TaxID=860790 RepID=A0A5D3YGI3_9BACT|nr:VCBS repeat-containing protein [Fodinibius salinus]TYP92662.1 Repeat domain-containing protein [Fodinibius salinus]
MKISYLICIILFVGLISSSCQLNLNDDGDDGGRPDTASVFYTATDSLPSNLSGTSNNASTADLDGDGDLDIALALPTARNLILFNNGNGTFSTSIISSQANNSQSVITTDFNSDGRTDIFFVNLATNSTQNSELYINSQNNFSDLSNQIPVNGAFTSVDLTDFNDDGLPDMLIGSETQNSLLRNNGNGSFDDLSTQRLPQFTGITRDVVFGDITGNNLEDIIIANQNSNRVLINTGSGFFTDQSGRYPFLNQVEESRDVELADVDADGDLDLFVGNSNLQGGASSQDRLLINKQGSFVDQTTDRLPDLSSNTFDTEFADFDGDRAIDLAVGNYDGGLRLLLNNGNGFFNDQSDSWIPKNFFPLTTDIEIGDYNNDGSFDIYVAVRNGTDQLLLQHSQ